MKSVFRTIATIALVLAGVNYTTAQAGFLYENVDVGSSNSTIGTAYDIDLLFGTVEPLYVGTSFEVDGTPFIQDSSGTNISSTPHVQIASDESGRSATKDYFSFNALAGSLLTLDVDCAYITSFSPGHSNPCDFVIGSGVSVADTVLKLIAPDGTEIVNDDGGIIFTTDGSPSDDHGTSNETDSFLEQSLFMSGLWVIEIGQFGGFVNGIATIDPFATDQAYLLSVTLSPVPVPAALWLFGSALIGLIGVSRRKVQA